MALSSTILHFAVQLADVDRGVYESLELRVAQHPSETPAFMLTRLLAYCLEYREGIAFTEGVSAGDEPAILVRDLTGQITGWIEVGQPDADRIHRGSKVAADMAIYTHRDPAQVIAQCAGKRIHRAESIPLYSFERGFLESMAGSLERRNSLSLSVTERQLYLDLNGQAFETLLSEQHLAQSAQ